MLSIVKLVNTKTIVKWNFEPNIIYIGKSINLVCTVYGVDNLNSSWTRQWSKSNELICYNGHPKDPLKYREILLNGNQFKLQINNVTDSDLNCKYQCRYSFKTETKKLGISSDNFEYPPETDTKAMVYTNKSEGNLTIDLTFDKIFPLPNCTAFIEDSSLRFDVVATTRNGNYYAVSLRHQSSYDLICSQHVTVVCQCIKEYIIPTEKVAVCKLEEKRRSRNSVIVAGYIVTIIITITAAVSVLIYMYSKRKKRKEKYDSEYKNDITSEQRKNMLEF